MGLNSVDTRDIAVKKGREWGVRLHASAKEHAARAHKAGDEAMTEEKYRQKISKVLQEYMSASEDTLGGINWSDEKVQAFFVAARFAFLGIRQYEF